VDIIKEIIELLVIFININVLMCTLNVTSKVIKEYA